jgi:tRNA(Ile2) C34 agmatinyltransferase TiaS
MSELKTSGELMYELIKKQEEEIERLRKLAWDNGVCPECGSKADDVGNHMHCTDCDATSGGEKP